MTLSLVHITAHRKAIASSSSTVSQRKSSTHRLRMPLIASTPCLIPERSISTQWSSVIRSVGGNSNSVVSSPWQWEFPIALGGGWIRAAD